MPAKPSTTSFAIAPVAGMVVRGSQQPAMVVITHHLSVAPAAQFRHAAWSCWADRLRPIPFCTRNPLNPAAT